MAFHDGSTAVLTIDLDAIVANWRLLCGRAGKATCAAVVKANAYGLGAGPVVRALYAAGCRSFFVAMVDEGVAVAETLRAVRSPPGGGDGSMVYVLHGVASDADADQMLASGLVPVLNSLGDIARWQATARRSGRVLPAGLHIDTGMARLGLPPAETATLTQEPERLRGIRLACIVSHLACADEPAHPLNAVQLSRFRDALARLPPTPASLANSAGIFLGPAYIGQMVRPGIALYGGAPSTHLPNPVQPVIRLHAPILQVRAIDAGDSVGYGATHQSATRERIATVGVGYADGFFRSLSNCGTGLIGGQRVPLVGRVSMDLITFDVTAVPEALARPGAPVELIGPAHPIDAVAAQAGRIAYEVLTALGSRYRRVYRGAGS
jgi:alanine racemase